MPLERNDCHGDESDLELLRRKPERDPDATRDNYDWLYRIIRDEGIQSRNRDVMADIGRALQPETFNKFMRKS